MAYLFSLKDSTVYLQILANEPRRLKRRVVTVETLEGSESRDLGASASDLEFSISAVLTDDALVSLMNVAEKGEEMGISFSTKTYSAFIRSVGSEMRKDKNYDVKIGIAVTGEI